MQGFAIGNGLTDPAIQYNAYIDYALDNGIIKESQSKRIKLIVPLCEAAIKLCGNYASLALSISIWYDLDYYYWDIILSLIIYQWILLLGRF